MVAIAIAVTAILKVPVASLFSTTSTVSASAGLGMTVTATYSTLSTAGAIAAGATAAAAGAIASQAFGVATGIQNKFSWKSVGLAALTGGITAGLGQVGALNGASGFAGTMQDAARGMMANAATQGLAHATGLQGKFNWAGVAVAGAVSGTSSALTPVTGGGWQGGMANSMAGAIAGSAARSLIDGSSFGDNLIAALPDVIGSTIGTIVAGVAVSNMTRRPSQVAISAESEMWPAALGIGPSFEHRPLMLFRGADAEQESRFDWMHRGMSSISDTITTTVGAWIDYGEDIVVTAKRTLNYYYKQGQNALGVAYNVIDTLNQTIAKNIMRPRTATQTDMRYEQSLRARAIAGLPKYSSPEGYFIASDHPTTAEFSIRSRMAQYRLVDQISSISGKISPYFGEGSKFNSYISKPTGKVADFLFKITIAEGTPADTLIAKPFWGATGLIDHYVDPGMIATLESNGLGRLPGVALSSGKYLNALKTGRMAAAESAGAFRSSSAAGEIFDPAKFTRIQAALEKQGVTFVTGDEGANLARSLGGEALYWPLEPGKPGVMVFGPNPTRTQVVEELLHYGQHKALGFGSVSNRVVELEIQAQNRLLQVGPRLGWTPGELAQIERARSEWMMRQ